MLRHFSLKTEIAYVWMVLLAHRISDKRALRLIGVYLRAGVKLPEGEVALRPSTETAGGG